jgi:hypothetical protein
MMTWMKLNKAGRSYLVSLEGAEHGKNDHVFTDKLLPNGSVARVLDQDVHNKALHAASTALRKSKIKRFG